MSLPFWIKFCQTEEGSDLIGKRKIISQNQQMRVLVCVYEHDFIVTRGGATYLTNKGLSCNNTKCCVHVT